MSERYVNPLSANFTKWSNTLKQFVGKLSTNCLSVFDQFVGLALKGLSHLIMEINLSRKKKLNLPRPRIKVYYYKCIDVYTKILSDVYFFSWFRTY